MTNPYKAPVAAPESDVRRGWAWLWYGVGSFLFMVALNGLVWLATRENPGTDGYEQIGFPWVFYEYGGDTGDDEFRYPSMLIADFCVAVLVALVASCFHRQIWIGLTRSALSFGAILKKKSEAISSKTQR